MLDVVVERMHRHLEPLAQPFVLLGLRHRQLVALVDQDLRSEEGTEDRLERRLEGRREAQLHPLGHQLLPHRARDIEEGRALLLHHRHHLDLLGATPQEREAGPVL